MMDKQYLQVDPLLKVNKLPETILNIKLTKLPNI